MDDFCICLTSQPIFDNVALSLFHHWCSGKSPEETESTVCHIFKEVDDEYALEFPYLRYRLNKQSGDAGSVSSKVYGQGGSRGQDPFSSQQTFVPFPTQTLTATQSQAQAPALSTVASVSSGAESEKFRLGQGQGQSRGPASPSPPTPAPLLACALTDRLKNSLEEEDIRAHYRYFRALETYLCNPQLLASQTLVPVPQDKQAYMIDNYWQLDDVVVRALMSNKRGMSTSRKDLDEVTDSTGIYLRSVMRQFSNLKRIYSEVDEDEGDVNLYNYIRTRYLLSPQLTRKYCCIIFLFYAKFILNGEAMVSPRRHISCASLEKCGAVILSCLVSRQDAFYRTWYVTEKAIEDTRRKATDEDNKLDQEQQQQPLTVGQAQAQFEGAMGSARVLPPAAPATMDDMALAQPVLSSVPSIGTVDGSERESFFANATRSMSYMTGASGYSADSLVVTADRTLSYVELSSGRPTYPSVLVPSVQTTAAVESSSSSSSANATSSSSSAAAFIPAESPSVASLGGTATATAAAASSPSATSVLASMSISGAPATATATATTTAAATPRVRAGSSSGKEKELPALDIGEFVPQAMMSGNDKQCWSCIWEVFKSVGAVDPDKDLLITLRDLRVYFTGEALNRGVQDVRKALQVHAAGGARILQRFDEAKMRVVCKALLFLGSNLSQSREYRAMVEDMLTKIAEPLLNDIGLNREQISVFLLCCSRLADALVEPSGRAGSAASLATQRRLNITRRKDWLRFVLCTRLVVDHLLA